MIDPLKHLFWQTKVITELNKTRPNPIKSTHIKLLFFILQLDNKAISSQLITITNWKLLSRIYIPFFLKENYITYDGKYYSLALKGKILLHEYDMTTRKLVKRKINKSYAMTPYKKRMKKLNKKKAELIRSLARKPDDELKSGD